jgi:acyl carrier protein
MPDDKVQVVIALVADVLSVPEHELGPHSSMENMPLWDSVEHMNICLAFEQRFGTRLDMDAVTTATSVRSLAALVP